MTSKDQPGVACKQIFKLNDCVSLALKFVKTFISGS